MPDEPTTPPTTPTTTEPPAPAPDPIEALRNDIANDLASMRRELETRPTPPPATPIPQPAPPSPAQLTELRANAEKAFYTDPLGHLHVAKEVAKQEVRGEMLQTFGPTLERSARETARATDPELFDKLAVQVDQKMKLVAPEVRLSGDAWINAFRMTIGEHYKTLTTSRRSAPPPNDGPSAPTTPPPPAPPAPKLTDEERRTARRFNMTDEQYIQNRDDYGNQKELWRKRAGIKTLAS